MDDNIEWLEECILDDPTLAHGVFFTEGELGSVKNRQAYVIAIIDPLTGFK